MSPTTLLRYYADGLGTTMLRTGTTATWLVIEQLFTKTFLVRSTVLINANSISLIFGKCMARASKVFGYRTLGTIEQQILTTSTLFQAVPDLRFRTFAPISLTSLPMEEKEMCSVCLDIFNADDWCFMAPCKHMYHTQCILNWIHISNAFSCPFCRLDMYWTLDIADRQAYYANLLFQFILDTSEPGFSFDFLPVGKNMIMPANGKNKI